MLRAASLALLLIGVALVAYGLYGGLSALAGIYQGAMDAPLDQPPDAEKGAAAAMLAAAGVGAAGVPCMLAGLILLRVGRMRARRARRAMRSV